MTIRKRTWGDGKDGWQVDLFVRGKRTRKQFATKAEAKAYELEVRTQARTGIFRPEATKMTVADVVPQYFAYLDERKKLGKRMVQATLVWKKAHVRNYIVGGVEFVGPRNSACAFEHGLGSYKLAELTPDVIEGFIDKVLAMGRSMKTARDIRITLVGLLDFAKRKGYVGVNAARDVKVIGGDNTKAKKKIIPPSKELVLAMVSSASDDFVRLAVLFSALTGLRASEQWALRWRHIDLSKGWLTVETRVDRWDNERCPKSEAGIREVPLARPLIAALKQWRERTKCPGDGDLVFPNPEGTYMVHNKFRKTKFDRLFKLAIKCWPNGKPVPARPRWHDLRHFAISCWIEAGLPPHAIQQYAGHANVSTTMNIYGHLFPSEQHHSRMTTIYGGIFGVISRDQDPASSPLVSPEMIAVGAACLDASREASVDQVVSAIYLAMEEARLRAASIHDEQSAFITTTAQVAQICPMAAPDQAQA